MLMFPPAVQMHQECFQSYHESLVRRHNGQTSYEGKDVIELHKTEFLCPICRRLANVLLPVVNQGRFSKILRACVDDDLVNQKDQWEKFWSKCKNLPGALEQFAVQVKYSSLSVIYASSIYLTF